MEKKGKNSDKNVEKRLSKSARRTYFSFTEAQLLQELDANTSHADTLADLRRDEWRG